MSEIKKDIQHKNEADTTRHEETCEYPSAELYYKLLLDEYKYETDRARSLNTRVGTLISALAVMVSLFFQAIDFSRLLTIGSIVQDIFVGMSIFMILLCIGVLFLSILPKKYNHFKVEPFTTIKNKKMSFSKSVSFLIDAMASKIEDNREVNRKKAKMYHAGIVFLIIAIVFMLSSIVYQSKIMNDVEGVITMCVNSSDEKKPDHDEYDNNEPNPFAGACYIEYSYNVEEEASKERINTTPSDSTTKDE